MKADPLPKRTVSEKDATIPVPGQWRMSVPEGHLFLVLRVDRLGASVVGEEPTGLSRFRHRTAYLLRCTTDKIPSDSFQRLRTLAPWLFMMTLEQIAAEWL